MNPNSANQRWSLWTWRVFPERRVTLPFTLVRDAMAREARRRFGAAGQMNVEQIAAAPGQAAYWRIRIRIEGHPAHEGPYVSWMFRTWREYFLMSFGPCRVEESVKFEAGDRQDGRPRDQLVILPGRHVDHC